MKIFPFSLNNIFVEARKKRKKESVNNWTHPCHSTIC